MQAFTAVALMAASLALAVASPTPALAAGPTTLYVAAGANGTACSQAQPCGSIQAAATSADAFAGAVQIDVGPGTYTENDTVPATSSPAWSSLSIDGSGAGTTTIVSPTPTGGTVLTASSGVVSLSGLTITGGKATLGGGINDTALSLTVSDSDIVGNVASAQGGGIYQTFPLQGATLTLTNDLISNNSGGEYGGGVDMGRYANLIASDDTISNNTALYGGGVYGPYASSTFSNASILGNVGGGINSGNLQITNSDISNNIQGLNFGAGGGVAGDGLTTITDSTISGNINMRDGGGISATGTFVGDIIENNQTTEGDGGGIYGGNSVATNDVIAYNRALGGGQLLNSKGKGGGADLTGTMANDTIVGNSSSLGLGGGVYGEGDPPPAIPLNLIDDTIADNSAPAGSGVAGIYDSATGTVISDNVGSPNCLSFVADGGYNLESDKFFSCGFAPKYGGSPTSLAGVDPGLESLANNGGPTATMAITSSSVAHDAIPLSNALCTGSTSGPSVDQRGVSRTRGSATGCDMGAYQDTAPQLGSLSPLSAGIGCPVNVSGFDFTDPFSPAISTRNVGAVSFGGVETSPQSVNSNSSLTVVVPNGVSPGVTQLSVANADGVSNTLPFTVTSGSCVPSAPTGLVASPGNSQISLSWATPSSDGGSPVTGYDVYIGTSPGGESASPVNVSPVTGTSDTVTGLTNGTTYYATVEAINALGHSPASNEASANAVAAPTVDGISPSAGPVAGGTSVTITGTSFTGATGVDFGANAATAYTVVSATQITATVPAGSAGTVDVVVDAPGGTGTFTNGYTYYVASLSLTKSTTSTGYGAAGQTIAYSYLVTNTGTVTLTGVGVGDNMNVVSCPSSTLAVGANETCTGTYTVTQADVDVGSVANTASASATGPQMVTSSPSTVTVLASLAISSMDLTVSTTSTGYGSAGQMIPYSFLVTNLGTTTLTGVSVASNLSAVSCPSGTLAPEVNETCTGTYTVSQGDVDAGSVTNTATATGNHGTDVASAESSVAVLASNCQPPVITSANSATATAGTHFRFTVTTCSATVPVLKGAGFPSGITLVDNHDGTATISGTTVGKFSGIRMATITATVKNQAVFTQHLRLIVDASPVFKSKATDLTHTGIAFNYPITTVYGYPVPTITTSSTLPAGVSLVDNGNGTAALTGTPGPLSGGVHSITITATNGVGSPVNQSFTLTVYQAPQITSAAADTITAGVAMTPFTVTDTGYPTAKLTAEGLPYGVKLTDNHNLTGTIAGTTRATAAGVYVVTITASGKAGGTIETFTLTVN